MINCFTDFYVSHYLTLTIEIIVIKTKQLSIFLVSFESQQLKELTFIKGLSAISINKDSGQYFSTNSYSNVNLCDSSVCAQYKVKVTLTASNFYDTYSQRLLLTG